MRGMSEANPSRAVPDLPHASGPVTCQARFRSAAADFVVDERVDVPEHPTGAHWWLRITKTGLNTKDVVKALTELSSARARRIGYAGLKDRHAVTTQWFSVPLENLDPESIVDRLPEGMVLEEWRRARHAVRRGGLRANRFRIRLRQVTGEPSALCSISWPVRTVSRMASPARRARTPTASSIPGSRCSVCGPNTRST